jgi:vancomycin resistance protein YoaR
VARATRWDDEPGREDAGGRVVLALILGLALLSGTAYVAASLTAGDKIPVGTQVAGVDIGGHHFSSAVVTLRDGLSDRADMPFTVTVNGHTQQVRPRRVGLGIDYAATVRRAGAQRSWRPSHLWAYYTSGSTYQPVVTLDQAKLATLLKRLDSSDGRDPTDGSVEFRRHTFVVHPPRPGLVLDAKSAGAAFWSAYLSDHPSVQLPLAQTAPTVDARATHRFVRTFANRAVASSVRLQLGRATVRLAPGDYARFLGSRRVGRGLRPTVDAAGLAAVTDRRLAGQTLDRPRDATVALVHGRPQVVPARAGLAFAPHDVAAALLQAIGSPDRSARVRSTVARASFGNADARRLGIRRRISSFSVHLPRGHAGPLLAAAQRVDGTVLRPGRTFSLRGALGAGTPEGRSGSALATAVFNAAWLAGLPVGAHAVAPSYDGSYPVGRDASLRDGHDLAFADRSPYGVLVSAVAGRPTAAHGATLTVSLWSTRRWSVASSHSDPTHVVHAPRVVRHGRTCSRRTGHAGFDVTVTRSLAPVASAASGRTTSYTVHYAAVPRVVCRR